MQEKGTPAKCSSHEGPQKCGPFSYYAAKAPRRAGPQGDGVAICDPIGRKQPPAIIREPAPA